MEITQKRCGADARKPLSILAHDMHSVLRSIPQRFANGISEVNMADGLHKDWREL